MKTIKAVAAFLAAIILLPVGSINAQSKEKPEKVQEKQTYADGPYLMYTPDGKTRVISVDTKGKLQDTLFTTLPADFSLPVVSHSGKHTFDVKLHKFARQPWKQKQPAELFVLSDPHGNLDYFVSVLKGNNVINDNYEWIYGKNHLLIVGDVFDRGKDVLPIFWLIYKLEEEAGVAGGQVSFLLGNHEPMVLAGDLRYADEMYKDLADRLNLKYETLFGPDTELGRWLGTRNTIQVIGDNLIVHAGISKSFLEQNLSIPLVNEEVSKALFANKAERKSLSPLTEFLYGSQGPIWYRGMVRNDEKYLPLHQNHLTEILRKYKADRVIVGHTIFPDVSLFYNNRVIAVNVDNKKNFDQVLGRGILIKKGHIYVVNDKGIMRKIQ